jgi:dUTPase
MDIRTNISTAKEKRAKWKDVKAFNDMDNGKGSFGHTGKE